MEAFSLFKSRIEKYLDLLQKLEAEYQGKHKSNTYLQKRVYYKTSALHWLERIKQIGKESPIMQIRFRIPEQSNSSTRLIKQYQTILIGVNEDIAKQIILLENPEAMDFSFKIIQPGILKEIK